MDFAFHDHMSEFLKSTALSPPRREGEGFDLLDLVVVDPDAEDPAKMLLPTETNLLEHFATKRKIHRRNRSNDVSPVDEKRVSTESFELTDELKSAIGMEGVNAHASGSHSSAATVNLVISNEKSSSISGATFTKIEGMVKNNFHAIVKNAARFHLDKDHHWYDYYTGKQDVYFIAVVTKVYQGSISIKENDKVSFGASVGAKVKGVWDSLTEGRRSESNSVAQTSEGIVGVQLLCFPFQKTEEVGVYKILDAISIHWMDENERKRLQRASKRHSWATVESKGDGSINISARRFSLADYKASVTSSIQTAVAYAKREFKMHDLRRVKSILTSIIAMLLVLPILAGSVSTIVSFLDANTGPRLVYAVQQVLSEGLADSTALLLRGVVAITAGTCTC